MRDNIPLSKPNIDDNDIANVVNVLESGMLVQGSKVEELESLFSKYFNNNVIALSNGTSTLHLALIASGIGEGDEVIVPAFSYIATANVVELVGAKPIFVDIEIGTFNIDVSKIEDAISSKTKAIIPVHEFGLMANMPEIDRFAEKYGLKVIEDAACALGSKLLNKLAGTFGDFGSFSLHPRKAITSGEGGILIFKDAEQIEKIKALRNHGIKILNNRQEFVLPGFNYRMTDIQAALVINQFKRLNEILIRKNEIADIYNKQIKNDLFAKPLLPQGYLHTWQTYHLIVTKGQARDKMINYLKQKGIGSNYGAQCIPFQDYYMRKYKLDCSVLFPNAMNAYQNGIAIPLYDRLENDNVNYIIETLNNFTV
jgi:dTDP-4-amino-4,6-dideoxygalactose transaminase